MSHDRTDRAADRGADRGAADRSAADRGPTDLQLISGVAGGSEDSFRLLFRRWSPRLARFLIHATGSRETGEDLLQEAFLRILRAAPRFTPRGEVGSWMYRICANLAYSHWRRVRTSRQAENVLTDGWVVTPAESPERKRVLGEFAGEARAAVHELPENQRMVFLLKVEQGLRYEEIASVLDCPVGTAKSRFHHAVRKLRSALGAWDDSPDARWRTTNGV